MSLGLICRQHPPWALFHHSPLKLPLRTTDPVPKFIAAKEHRNGGPCMAGKRKPDTRQVCTPELPWESQVKPPQKKACRLHHNLCYAVWRRFMMALPWSHKVYSCTLADPLSLAPTASFIFFGGPVRVPFQTRPNKGRTELGAGLLLQHLIKVLTWHPLHPGRFYITHYLLCYGNLNNLRAPAWALTPKPLWANSR